MMEADLSHARLPSFVIIGAAKAATTWVLHQLRQNPQVFMPEPEPHYFSTEYARGPGWYARWFTDAGADQVVGEKSADYLADPHAAQRMAALLPGARLVVQLRNPVERAYSDYCMLFRRGAVDASPEKYLNSGAGLERFLQDGLYHRHLSRFLDHYPREAISLLLHEDIKAAPGATIARVCGHIGVAPFLAPAEVGARVNHGKTPILPLALRKLLAPVKQAAVPFRSAPWFKATHAALARTPKYPPLTADLRRRLRDFYASDIERLAPAIGRDLSAWLTPAEAEA